MKKQDEVTRLAKKISRHFVGFYDVDSCGWLVKLLRDFKDNKNSGEKSK